MIRAASRKSGTRRRRRGSRRWRGIRQGLFPNHAAISVRVQQFGPLSSRSRRPSLRSFASNLQTTIREETDSSNSFGSRRIGTVSRRPSVRTRHHVRTLKPDRCDAIQQYVVHDMRSDDGKGEVHDHPRHRRPNDYDAKPNGHGEAGRGQKRRSRLQDACAEGNGRDEVIPPCFCCRERAPGSARRSSFLARRPRRSILQFGKFFQHRMLADQQLVACFGLAEQAPRTAAPSKRAGA